MSSANACICIIAKRTRDIYRGHVTCCYSSTLFMTSCVYLEQSYTCPGRNSSLSAFLNLTSGIWRLPATSGISLTQIAADPSPSLAQSVINPALSEIDAASWVCPQTIGGSLERVASAAESVWHDKERLKQGSSYKS